MPSEPIHADLISRLRSVEGHVRGIIRMVESGAHCQDIVLQVLAVQGALREVNCLLVQHHLNDCVRSNLWDANPAVRDQIRSSIIELYALVGASAGLSTRKEPL